MDDQDTRTCRICAETIKRAARLCPYCRADQRKSAINIIPPPWLAWLGWSVMLLVVLGGLSVAYRMFNSGKDFAPFRDQFAIVSSSMEFSKRENGQHIITTIGVVRNNCDYAWKGVQLEVRYFDQEGKLIDMGVEMFSDVLVQPHSESAFRVRTFADRPESAYASHKVFVRSAEDIRRWP